MSHHQSGSKGSEDLTFPLLTSQEIGNCLNELEIPFAPDDISKPTSARVMQLYEHFMLLLLGERAISFAGGAGSFNQLNNLNGNEENQYQASSALISDSMQLLSFHRKLLQVCICAGLDVITLRDILNPNAKRTKLILSGLINFCKFREERMILFEECSEKTEALLQKREELDKKLQDITERVNSLRMARAQEQPKVLELRKVTSTLAGELRELKKAQTLLAQDMENLKLEKSKIAEKLTNNSFLITNVKQDCVRLQSRIVSDPAKLLQTIQEMNASVKTDKQNVMVAERKSRELRGRLEAMDAVEGDLEICRELLGEAEIQREKCREASRTFGLGQDGFSRKQNVLRDLEIKEQQQSRQYKQAGDKLARLFSHQAQREQSNEVRKDKLESEFQQVKADNERAVNAKQDATVKIEDMLEQTRETEKIVESELVTLNNSFNKLVTQVGAYQREMSMGMV